MEWTKKGIAGAGAGLLVVIALIPSDDGSKSASTSGDADRPAAQSQSAAKPRTENVAAEAPEPELILTMPSDRTVYRDRVTVAGRLTVDGGGNTKGVSVTVDGKPAPVRDGRWSKTITVHAGGNEIEVEATKGSYESDEESVEFTRERSKAERAAVAAKRRAAAAARKQNYMASAKSIPYNQLEKNADRFSGDRAYEGTIKGAEDDVITVYGTIEGSKSYETQIGGETYVPQMTARYVVE